VDRANGIHLSYLDEGHHKEIQSANNAKYGDGITNARFRVTDSAFEATSSLAYFFSLELSNTSTTVIRQQNGSEYANVFINSSGELAYDDDGGSGVSSGTAVSQGEYQITLHRVDNGNGTADTKVKLFNSDGTLHSSIDITNRSLPSGSGGQVTLGDFTITDVTFYESRIWVDDIPSQADLDTMADPNATGPTNFEDKVEGQETAAWFHEPAPVRNNSWGDRNGSSEATGNGATRALGNIIQNQDNIRIVTITPHLSAPLGNIAKATVEVGTDLSNAVDYKPAEVSQESGASTQRERRYPVSFLVKPGEEYRIKDASSSGGGVSLASSDGATWYEFDFDATYSPQSWTHNENLDPGKLRTYAHNAFGVGDTTTGSDARYETKLGNEVNVEGMNLVTHNFNMGSGLSTNSEANIDQRDKDGTLSNIASAFIQNSDGTMDTSAFFGVNPSGAYQYYAVNGDVNDAYGVENRPPTLPVVSFQDGNVGGSVDTKFTDLDNNTAKGLNIEQDPTRNEDVNGNDGSKSTPSGDRWSIVSATVALQPSSTSTAQYSEIRLWDTSDTEKWGLIPQEYISATTTDANTYRTMMTFVPPDWSWDLQIDSNSTITKRTEWVL
jgi:hypothetical protein